MKKSISFVFCVNAKELVAIADMCDYCEVFAPQAQKEYILRDGTVITNTTCLWCEHTRSEISAVSRGRHLHNGFLKMHSVNTKHRKKHDVTYINSN